MTSRYRNLLLATSALVPLGLPPANANPLGGQVVGGNASVHGQGTASVTVTQSTAKAIINWNTFNIGAGERTQFLQPNSSSVTLNRVTGGLGPSQLYGTLTANGRIFLVNPDGILIGKGAVIDTAGFLATTHDIKNDDFMAGRYNFGIPGRPDVSIVNQGTITAHSGGFAALVAPGVRNSGTITATLGNIGLASGNSFSLDFYGDKLITLGVNDQVAAVIKDVATGQPINALVKNEGTLKANGGKVELTAVAARQVVDAVINNTGVIEAISIGSKNGMIVLGVPTGANKPAGAPTQTVKLSGVLSAAGNKIGEKGGKVIVTGEAISVAGAQIDASGRAGGGTVLVGGDWMGGKPMLGLISNASAKLETFNIPTATVVTVDAASLIDASAMDAGNGGKVIVWADQATTFYGTIRTRGGPSSGDGGFVETSGRKDLTFGGTVDIGTANGKNGTLLLDPANGFISSIAGAGVILASSIQNALATGDVIVTTGAVGGEPGDLTVAAPINWATGNALKLNAIRNVAINANITSTGGGAVDIRADNTGTGVGTVSFGAGAQIFTFGPVSIFYNPASYSDPTTKSDLTSNPYAAFISGGSATSWMLVNTVGDIQEVQNNLLGKYALGKDIDASATSNWNGGAGFVPIGNSTEPFVGIFDGNGHTIDKLTIQSAADFVGVFGYVGGTGTIQNLTLTNLWVFGTSASSTGGLAGYNAGMISQSRAEGIVFGAPKGSVGGLVGTNLGIIDRSSASATVTAKFDSSVGFSSGPNSNVGGLVGLNQGTITRSSATAPALAPVSSIDLNGDATGVFVSGQFAYVVASNAGLKIIDISNPESPIVVGTYGGLSGAVSVAVSGNYAYVGGPGGLTVVDISNPQSPILVASYPFTGSNFSMVVKGSNLYLPDLSTGMLRILDVSNPANVTQVGSLTANSNGQPFSIALNGDYAYIADFQRVYIVDVSNPMSPTLISSLMTRFPAAVAVAGNTAYVAGQDGGGLQIFDVSNPAMPNFIGSYIQSAVDGYWSIQVVGSYAYLLDFGGTVRKLDISKPSQPFLVGAYPTGSAGYTGIFLSNNFAYATANLNGLSIFDTRSKTSAVSGGPGANAGGLVGKSVGTITESFSDLTSIGYSFNNWSLFGTTPGGVGGLVGHNTGLIDRSYALGGVVGSAALGGLVGVNDSSSSIWQSYAAGNVDGGGINGSHVGGLVGLNYGTVGASYATGQIHARSIAGGLIGSNSGFVFQSFATGGVETLFESAGGLIGYNSGIVANSFASGAITSAPSSVGGLIGSNGGLVTQSYASGSVFGATVGGLVGHNGGIVDQSYSSGLVTGSGNSGGAAMVSGGLVGNNGGTITDSYTLGAIEGFAIYAGGLVGFDDNRWGTNVIARSYAVGTMTGLVAAGGSNGGLVGGIPWSCGCLDPVMNSYWDTQTTGLPNSLGGVGLTTSELKANLPNGFNSSNAVWTIDAGQSYPYLLWQILGVTPAPPTPGALPAIFDSTSWGVALAINNRNPYLHWQLLHVDPPPPPTIFTSGLPIIVPPPPPIITGNTTQTPIVPPSTLVIPNFKVTDPKRSTDAQTGEPTNPFVPNDASVKLPTNSTQLRPRSSTTVTSDPKVTGSTSQNTEDGYSRETLLLPHSVSPFKNAVSAQELLWDVLPFVDAAASAYDANVADWASYFENFDPKIYNQSKIREIEGSGFQAKLVFVNGRPVLAFAGTNPCLWSCADGKADLETVDQNLSFGKSRSDKQAPQFEYARELTIILSSLYPDLIVTGHSLGGGLAAYAGATNHLAAITFAPIAPHFGRSDHVSSNTVLNFRIGTDAAQARNLGESLVGQTVVFDRSLLSEGKTHGLEITATGPNANQITGVGFQISALDMRHGLERYREIYDNIAGNKSVGFVSRKITDIGEIRSYVGFRAN